ncbi:mucin-2-like [Scylla paramamosain]|uniref:mucin-2-like n=1 Tax=Scylla paramamosain TaxID=85552 RepID=UPI0030830E37
MAVPGGGSVFSVTLAESKDTNASVATEGVSPCMEKSRDTEYTARRVTGPAATERQGGIRFLPVPPPRPLTRHPTKGNRSSALKGIRRLPFQALTQTGTQYPDGTATPRALSGTTSCAPSSTPTHSDALFNSPLSPHPTHFQVSEALSHPTPPHPTSPSRPDAGRDNTSNTTTPTTLLCLFSITAPRPLDPLGFTGNHYPPVPINSSPHPQPTWIYGDQARSSPTATHASTELRSCEVRPRAQVTEKRGEIMSGCSIPSPIRANCQRNIKPSIPLPLRGIFIRGTKPEAALLSPSKENRTDHEPSKTMKKRE